MKNKIPFHQLKRVTLATFVGMGLLSSGLLASTSSYAETTPVKAEAQTKTAVPVLTMPDFTKVVAETQDAVVNIRTMETVKQSSYSDDGDFDPSDPSDLFKFFFGPDNFPPGFFPPQQHRSPHSRSKTPERTVPRGVGSGFLISKDGYIITNNHVIEDSSKIIVTLNDGKEYDAKVIGSDKRTDIALLKIKANDLPFLKIGDSDELKKGQWVLAIGSPFDLDSTVTAGIVSAINRDTGEYLPFIQTDVAVNPGNSGGPLINLAGEVVGVNSQIISQSGGYMGISLSIPIDEVMRVVDQLKSTGKVTRGRIGVQITEVGDDVAKALGLSNAKGALISSVEPDSPADNAGVQPGDVILSYNGSEVKRWSDLPRLVGQTKPGTESDLKVWRRGKEINLKIKIAAIKNDESDTGSVNDKDTQGEQHESKQDRLGLVVGKLSEKQIKKDRIQGGVLVKSTEDPAASAGLRKGDVILAVNDADIKSVEDFKRAVEKLPKGKTAALLVRRDKLTQWITLIPNDAANSKGKKEDKEKKK